MVNQKFQTMKLSFKLAAIAVILLAVAGLSFTALEAYGPKKATPPHYKKHAAETVTDAATIYHELANIADDNVWLPSATSVSVQIHFDETSGAATTTATLQGTNQLDAVSPTWVDVWSPAAWTADEDTLITFTPVYALYRLKFAQTGTATSSIRTDWIAE